MRAILVIAAAAIGFGCLPLKAEPAATADAARPAEKKPAAPADSAVKPKADAGKKPGAAVKSLTAEQRERLLGTRLGGGMDFTFAQFANMFLVSSRINLGPGIGLMASSQEIAEAQLQSPFPETYKPTLREFLDSIALQTSSEWKYDPSGKHLRVEGAEAALPADLVIFEFKSAKREKPFEVTVAEGWKPHDHGNWVLYRPPSFPVGMDIYEMGTYSPEDPKKEKGFADKIRSEVSLSWARRVDPKVQPDGFKHVQAGKFDSLYFEATIQPQPDKKIKWRQWVFMDGNKCYFIVSTILPELEEKIYPEVQKMLASFRIKGK